MGEAANAASNNLLQYGAIGAVLVLALFGLAYLVTRMDKRHAAEHEECRQDRLASATKVEAMADDYHEQSTQFVNILTKLSDGQQQLNESVKANNEGQSKIIEKLGTTCQWNGSERRR